MTAGQMDAQDTAGEATPDSPLLNAVRFASSLGLGVPALTLQDSNTALEIICGLLDHVATGDAPEAALVCALRSLLTAASMGNLLQADPALHCRLDLAVEPAGLRMIHTVPHDIVGDELALGFASLRWLARFFLDPGAFQHKPDFAAVLVHHLDMIALAANIVDASIRRQRVLPQMIETVRLAEIWRTADRCDVSAIPIQ